MSPPENPSCSEVWQVNLNPTKGHEQAGTRPALVISVDRFNHGPAGLVIVVPVTSVDKQIRTHVRVHPPQGGLRETSYIKCEEVRCISKERLIRLLGSVDSKVMEEVRYAVSTVLGL